jgi:hypothetical protein
MATRFKNHPALKHGGYAAATILPGEDRAEFEKLHEQLTAELGPSGVLEEDIVATIARLAWRKQNLATLLRAQRAQSRYAEIISEKFDALSPDVTIKSIDRIDPAIKEKTIQAAQEQAKKELGEAYELVEIGETASFDQLVTVLKVMEYLDSLIDRLLKRLLYLRGLKSISPASRSAHSRRPALSP